MSAEKALADHTKAEAAYQAALAAFGQGPSPEGRKKVQDAKRALEDADLERELARSVETASRQRLETEERARQLGRLEQLRTAASPAAFIKDAKPHLDTFARAVRAAEDALRQVQELREAQDTAATAANALAGVLKAGGAPAPITKNALNAIAHVHMYFHGGAPRLAATMLPRAASRLRDFAVGPGRADQFRGLCDMVLQRTHGISDEGARLQEIADDPTQPPAWNSPDAELWNAAVRALGHEVTDAASR